jgi:hypothetical protein
MDSPRWRTALNGVHNQDNFSFIKGIKQAKGAARELEEFASAVSTRPEAVDDFEPYIVVSGKEAAAAHHQQSIG